MIAWWCCMISLILCYLMVSARWKKYARQVGWHLFFGVKGNIYIYYIQTKKSLEAPTSWYLIQLSSKPSPYCWWTKSCTTKDDDYPISYRVLTIPGGAGFLPSTVCKQINATLFVAKSLKPRQPMWRLGRDLRRPMLVWREPWSFAPRQRKHLNLKENNNKGCRKKDWLMNSDFLGGSIGLIFGGDSHMFSRILPGNTPFHR